MNPSKRKHQPSDVEIRKATAESKEALWKRYFATPPGPQAIALLAQIRRGEGVDETPEDGDDE